jgi:hypothetical protein
VDKSKNLLKGPFDEISPEEPHELNYFIEESVCDKLIADLYDVEKNEVTKRYKY